MRILYVIIGVSVLAALSIGLQLNAHRSADGVEAEPPIPSYALRHIRPGPLVPEMLTPTMVAPYDCDLAPGTPPG